MALRGFLYAFARLLGDVNAVKKGRVGRRVGRRAVGKVTGRGMRKLFPITSRFRGGVGAQ